jgi:hypothetical protein
VNTSTFRIEKLQRQIAELRQLLVDHPLYSSITDLRSLQIFTEQHVFAVWDFMSLVKALQRRLTCVTEPWVPVGTGATRYLINEIVTGEESDIDEKGVRTSHFELYLRAMQQAGSDTMAIQSLLTAVKRRMTIEDALAKAAIFAETAAFVRHTFDVIRDGRPHILAAVFTFGREDLIPGMFIEMVKGITAQFPGQADLLLYYLQRHIEVDGGQHSQLALEMVAELCGDDDEKWKEAANAAEAALLQRLALWDGIRTQIASVKAN